MTSIDMAHAPGSWTSPSFEHARVEDVMRHGIISCAPEAGLRNVARIMTTYHVHAVVVELGGDLWGIVTAQDLAGVAGTDRGRLSAGEIAATEFVTTTPDSPLGRVAQLMREHEIDHLVVSDERGGRPLGMISALDIAGCLAWGEA
jgi:CBS domain-containing protein